MSDKKTLIRFWSIAHFEEEEIWLREQHKQGWKFVGITPFLFYQFEKCTPEDVIYRLDYSTKKENDDYIQMAKDYGWEYITKFGNLGWLYFRKPASQIENETDGELLSDNTSKLNRISQIIKTRMLPLLVLFLWLVIPNAARALGDSYSPFISWIWIIIFALYVAKITNVGIKFLKLKKKYEK